METILITKESMSFTISNKTKLVFTLIANVLTLFLPLALAVLGDGFQDSISDYHNTDARWLLFSFLIFISFGFFTGLDKYKVSGILLILIAFVNVDYRILHNIIAVSFFLYTGLLMLYDKRFYIVSLPMFLLIPIISIIGFYAYEVVAIYCISLFNFLYVLRFLRVIHSK
jgi:hypothetical protein